MRSGWGLGSGSDVGLLVRCREEAWPQVASVREGGAAWASGQVFQNDVIKSARGRSMFGATCEQVALVLSWSQSHSLQLHVCASNDTQHRHVLLTRDMGRKEAPAGVLLEHPTGMTNFSIPKLEDDALSDSSRGVKVGDLLSKTLFPSSRRRREFLFGSDGEDEEAEDSAPVGVERTKSVTEEVFRVLPVLWKLRKSIELRPAAWTFRAWKEKVEKQKELRFLCRQIMAKVQGSTTLSTWLQWSKGARIRVQARTFRQDCHAVIRNGREQTCVLEALSAWKLQAARDRPWGVLFSHEKLDDVELEYVVVGLAINLCLEEASQTGADAHTDPSVTQELLVGADLPGVQDLRVRVSRKGRAILNEQRLRRRGEEGPGTVLAWRAMGAPKSEEELLGGMHPPILATDSMLEASAPSGNPDHRFVNPDAEDKRDGPAPIQLNGNGQDRDAGVTAAGGSEPQAALTAEADSLERGVSGDRLQAPADHRQEEEEGVTEAKHDWMMTWVRWDYSGIVHCYQTGREGRFLLAAVVDSVVASESVTQTARPVEETSTTNPLIGISIEELGRQIDAAVNESRETHPGSDLQDLSEEEMAQWEAPIVTSKSKPQPPSAPKPAHAFAPRQQTAVIASAFTNVSSEEDKIVPTPTSEVASDSFTRSAEEVERIPSAGSGRRELEEADDASAMDGGVRAAVEDEGLLMPVLVSALGGMMHARRIRREYVQRKAASVVLWKHATAAGGGLRADFAASLASQVLASVIESSAARARFVVAHHAAARIQAARRRGTAVDEHAALHHLAQAWSRRAACLSWRACSRVVQASSKRATARQRFVADVCAAVECQRRMRGRQAQLSYPRNLASSRLQAHCVRMLTRQHEESRRAAAVLQRSARCKAARSAWSAFLIVPGLLLRLRLGRDHTREYQGRRSAICRLQSGVRMRHSSFDFQRKIVSGSFLTVAARRWLERSAHAQRLIDEELLQVMNAISVAISDLNASRLQGACRAVLDSELYLSKRRAQLQLQASVQACLRRRAWRSQLDAAKLLQLRCQLALTRLGEEGIRFTIRWLWRRVKRTMMLRRLQRHWLAAPPRVEFDNLKSSAIAIQAAIRAHPVWFEHRLRVLGEAAFDPDLKEWQRAAWPEPAADSPEASEDHTTAEPADDAGVIQPSSASDERKIARSLPSVVSWWSSARGSTGLGVQSLPSVVTWWPWTEASDRADSVSEELEDEDGEMVNLDFGFANAWRPFRTPAEQMQAVCRRSLTKPVELHWSFLPKGIVAMGPQAVCRRWPHRFLFCSYRSAALDLQRTIKGRLIRQTLLEAKVWCKLRGERLDRLFWQLLGKTGTSSDIAVQRGQQTGLWKTEARSRRRRAKQILGDGVVGEAEVLRVDANRPRTGQGAAEDDAARKEMRDLVRRKHAELNVDATEHLVTHLVDQIYPPPKPSTLRPQTSSHSFQTCTAGSAASDLGGQSTAASEQGREDGEDGEDMGAPAQATAWLERKEIEHGEGDDEELLVDDGKDGDPAHPEWRIAAQARWAKVREVAIAGTLMDTIGWDETPTAAPEPVLVRTQRIDDQARIAKEVLKHDGAAVLFCGGSTAHKLQGTLTTKFKQLEEGRMQLIRDGTAAADPFQRIDHGPRRPSLPAPPGHRRRAGNSFDAAYEHGGRRLRLKTDAEGQREPPATQDHPADVKQLPPGSATRDEGKASQQDRTKKEDSTQAAIAITRKDGHAEGGGRTEGHASGTADDLQRGKYAWFKERRNRIRKGADKARQVRLEGLMLDLAQGRRVAPDSSGRTAQGGKAMLAYPRALVQWTRAEHKEDEMGRALQSGANAAYVLRLAETVKNKKFDAVYTAAVVQIQRWYRRGLQEYREKRAEADRAKTAARERMAFIRTQRWLQKKSSEEDEVAAHLLRIRRSKATTARVTRLAPIRRLNAAMLLQAHIRMEMQQHALAAERKAYSRRLAYESVCYLMGVFETKRAFDAYASTQLAAMRLQASWRQHVDREDLGETLQRKAWEAENKVRHAATRILQAFVRRQLGGETAEHIRLHHESAVKLKGQVVMYKSIFS